MNRWFINLDVMNLITIKVKEYQLVSDWGRQFFSFYLHPCIFPSTSVAFQFFTWATSQLHLLQDWDYWITLFHYTIETMVFIRNQSSVLDACNEYPINYSNIPFAAFLCSYFLLCVNFLTIFSNSIFSLWWWSSSSFLWFLPFK